MKKKLLLILFSFLFPAISFCSSITEIVTANSKMATPTLNFSRSVTFSTSNIGINTTTYEDEGTTYNYFVFGYPYDDAGTPYVPVDNNTPDLYVYGGSVSILSDDKGPSSSSEIGLRVSNPENGSTGFLLEIVGESEILSQFARGKSIFNSYSRNGMSFNLSRQTIPTGNPNFTWANWDDQNNGELMRLDLTGNLTVTSSITAKAVSINGTVTASFLIDNSLTYGELYVSYNSTVTNILVAGTYVTITANVVEGITKNVTFTQTTTDNYFTVLVGGIYNVNLNISFSGGNSDEFHGGVCLNGSNPVGSLEFNRKMGAGGDVGSAGCSGLIRLVAGDKLCVKITNETDADDPIIGFMNFSFRKIDN